MKIFCRRRFFLFPTLVLMKRLYVMTKTRLGLIKIKQLITAKQNVYKFYVQCRKDTQIFNKVENLHTQLAFSIEDNKQ